MRHAEWGAYVQAGFSLLVYVLLAIGAHDWVTPSGYGVMALVVGGLGFGVGRRHSAAAALVLVVLVLGLAILQLMSGGRPPALITVAIFAWLYGKGFTAAREYATLRVVPFESD
jgi:hypothetical protein